VNNITVFYLDKGNQDEKFTMPKMQIKRDRSLTRWYSTPKQVKRCKTSLLVKANSHHPILLCKLRVCWSMGWWC